MNNLENAYREIYRDKISPYFYGSKPRTPRTHPKFHFQWEPCIGLWTLLCFEHQIRCYDVTREAAWKRFLTWEAEGRPMIKRWTNGR